MLNLGMTARRIAAACCNYIHTRFPAGHDVPVCTIDQEWFADAAQKAIHEATKTASVTARTAGNAVIIERIGGGFDAVFGVQTAESAAFIASQINTAIAVALRDVATGDPQAVAKREG